MIEVLNTHRGAPMSVITDHRSQSTTRTESGPVAPGTTLAVVLGVTRLAMGWVFVWPFLDKMFGLGHETASADAWINGGSPTSGFLGHATSGPLASFYQGIAGHAWADWLFMLGLLGIGLGLMLGVASRLTAIAGGTLLILMWSAVLPPANNIFLDDHVVYALVLAILALSHAGATFGFASTWERFDMVRRFGILR
jgi:thiosulfate dehydrogenase [quinone] large subunit